MAELLHTDRLLLRNWSATDAQAALKIYGHDDVSRWLHDLDHIPDAAAMHSVLQRWDAERDAMAPGTGRWALTLRNGGTLVGGISLLPMPVPEADVEIGYQLAPEYWGRGYVTEAAWALAHWAFQHSLVELFAVVAPDNLRAAATARRIGMEWVGESGKYHGRYLQVFRLRPDDLAQACQTALQK
ncbi:MAG TPA: GNAT family N-acetyltransferase [Pseudonocardiaceae bacterium]|jgi:RimJ/RimL family protein N-acetyltransferase|nr:GNAT family N-acetyltransferase [Pseudonocardiaceae bacterium]